MTGLDDDLVTFLNALAVREPDLSRRLRARLRLLRNDLALDTVGDLWGLTHPVAPPRSASSCTRSFAVPTPGTAGHEARLWQLSAALALPMDTTRLLADRLEQLHRPLLHGAPVGSEWHTGCLTRTRLRSGKDYRVVDVHRAIRRAPRRDRPAAVGGLDERLGPAWDQGQRGTCVAHAAGGLYSYVNGTARHRLSFQFLYHQCKMIDGIPRQEGTYLETSMRVFSDRRISGPHAGWGSADAGLPAESAWPYEPRFRPGNPAQTPPPAGSYQALYRGPRWGNLSGRVLRCSLRGSALVEDIRALLFTAGLPVVIGLPLFPSFNNANSRRTGRIPVPLPGETPVGGHAMLVVGADDRKKAFIVRNSWSPAWAPENPYGLPGHAVIPYRYLEIHGSNAYSVEAAQRFRGNVEETDRLYRRVGKSSPLPRHDRPRHVSMPRRGSTRPTTPPPRPHTLWGYLFG